jgi:hypothetical protein
VVTSWAVTVTPASNTSNQPPAALPVGIAGALRTLNGMRKVRVSTAAVAATLAVGLVAGCGGGSEVTASGGGDRSTTSTTEATTTTVATTTTAPVDYAAQYMRLVAPSNCALNQMITALEGFRGVEYIDDAIWARMQQDLLPSIRAYSDAVIGFYEGLAAAEWPENVQADVDTLVAQLATEAAQARAAADAETHAVYVVLEDELWSPDENAAGVVRAKLGLESNVTEETDYCAAQA